MSDVQRYYEACVQYEWDRLVRRRTELAVTLRAFEEYLPPSPARIVDIGGGPGRYSIELAKQGYEVTLVDLSRDSLAFARERAQEAGVTLAGFIHANALDLSALPAGYFDAALLMGSLYHLLTEPDRATAVTETLRLMKPGAPFFAAFCARYAQFIYAARKDPAIIMDKDAVESLLATGIRNIDVDNGEWAPAYFIHPDEVRPFLEPLGLETTTLISCEGLVTAIEDLPGPYNEITGEVWQAWVDLNYRLGKDPCTHGLAAHLLYVGRKQE
jgi:S-adenosylmethionine-dependent methyltransferase